MPPSVLRTAYSRQSHRCALRTLENVVASQIHLVRHGEVANPDGILYGRLPQFGLSELGHKMAALAADDLAGRGRPMTALFASPLQRTRESAAPISRLLDLEVQLEPRIIEPSNKFEGSRMRGANSALKNPRTWPWLINPFRPSWGEPYLSIRDRMLEAITAAHESVESGDVILVSHQLPIWTTHLALAGKRFLHDPRSRRCTLSSITTLERQGSSFVEVGYAEPAASLLATAVDLGAV